MSMAGIFPLLVALVTPYLSEFWVCETIDDIPGCGEAFPTRQLLKNHRDLHHPGSTREIQSCSDSIKKLYSAVVTPHYIPQTGATFRLWEPMIFMLLWSSTPTATTAMFYFFTNELHFNPE
eukprot:TRINITY_DN6580_c0_g1_i2.p1 TRINITY_DN6580_c0_g1~~TRINITY_DN6580_c0_g1_i2.p1  ORF type:complete len:121 (+),score=5.03 TRINITY_DN6580_c0_g1_i2:175-537(+)